MPNVLIRDVPSDDLERIRFAAAEQDTSLQNYLRETVHAQAAYLRRQEVLHGVAERLRDRPSAPDEERDAVLDAVDAANDERAEELGEEHEQ